MPKNQPKNSILVRLFRALRYFQREMLLSLALIFMQFNAAIQAEPLIMDRFETALPDTAIITENGENVRFSDYLGKPLIVNFWATWCAPCIHELPALDRAAAQLADEVALLLVSVDRGGSARAADFLTERNITTPATAYDAKSDWARALGFRGLPSTLILSADQNDIWLVSGPAEWDTDKVLSQLRAQLAETK